MIEDPGSFAIVCVKTMKGYFLLANGTDQEVVDTVALPVAKALQADPGVLNFPLCWNMCVEEAFWFSFCFFFFFWRWAGRFVVVLQSSQSSLVRFRFFLCSCVLLARPLPFLTPPPCAVFFSVRSQ